MYQRAFLKMGACLVQDIAHLAVSPLLPSKRRGLTILALLLSVTAVHGNPLSQAPNAIDGLPIESLLVDMLETNKPAVQTSSEFSPSTFDLNSAAEQWLSPEFLNSSPSSEEAPSHESYPYLLLTGGLILLAFRPGHPALTGRF